MEYSIEKAVNVLKQAKPEGMSDILWQSITTNARQSLKDNVERELYYANDPLKKLESYDLQELSQEEVKLLREVAYLQQKRRTLPLLYDQVAVKRFVEAGKPDWLSNEDFKDLEVSAARYDEQQKLTEELRQDLTTEQDKVKALKEKYQICIQALQDFVLTGEVDDQYADAFQEEAWGRLKTIEKIWDFESRSLNLD